MSWNKRAVFHRYRVCLIVDLFGQWLEDAIQKLFKINDFFDDFRGFGLPKVRNYKNKNLGKKKNPKS